VEGRVVSSDVAISYRHVTRHNTHIILLGILIFKGLTARRLYKSFGVKGLISCYRNTARCWYEYPMFELQKKVHMYIDT
jgi:hypothetical protein